jgi:hypothetical protein
MNLFFLDRDLERLAQYHIDRHVGKMQLEAAQLMATTLWIDKLLGFVPRALNSDELAVVKTEMGKLPPRIDERRHMDISYKACHHNHPSAIWMRSSIEHYEWAFCYVQALNDECLYRGYKSHASCAEAQRMPEPKLLANMGWRDPDQAMPPELKTDDVLADYRLFYMLDKAAIPATWRGRDKPEWWDENIAMYDRRYTELSPAERKATGYLK